MPSNPPYWEVNAATDDDDNDDDANALQRPSKVICQSMVWVIYAQYLEFGIRKTFLETPNDCRHWLERL